MRQFLVLAAAGLALGGCFKPAPPTPAANASANAAQMGTGAQPGDDSQLTVAQLQAKADAAEAEARRLEAQANGQQAATAPTPSPTGASGTRTLGPANEKLQTGQYYDTLTFEATAGETYDLQYFSHGYRPVIVVLDPDNKPFTQSVAAPKPTTDYQMDDEIHPDRTGTWHVLLAAADVGAGGTYQANLQKETITPIQ